MEKQRFESVLKELQARPRVWLVTGAAGFIGSNICETLLRIGQRVRGLDNFSTGYRHNLEHVRAAVGTEAYSRFEFIEGDICVPADCAKACTGVGYVLHQAALGSVPRSVDDPITSNRVNVEGFLNVMLAARDAKVARVVYASSSAVFGDSETLPKQEGSEGKQLSPYAVTKFANELYADVCFSVYAVESIGLRYFNVFGPRQDPNGAYAAVVPRWIDAAISAKQCLVYGDGETTRDFCHIDNVVQANILAALAGKEAVSKAFNIAFGERTTLNDLHDSIWKSLVELRGVKPIPRRHESFRAGDVRHSLADISRARELLGYNPQISLGVGLKKLVAETLAMMGK